MIRTIYRVTIHFQGLIDENSIEKEVDDCLRPYKKHIEHFEFFGGSPASHPYILVEVDNKVVAQHIEESLQLTLLNKNCRLHD